MVLASGIEIRNWRTLSFLQRQTTSDHSREQRQAFEASVWEKPENKKLTDRRDNLRKDGEALASRTLWQLLSEIIDSAQFMGRGAKAAEAKPATEVKQNQVEVEEQERALEKLELNGVVDRLRSYNSDMKRFSSLSLLIGGLANSTEFVDFEKGQAQASVLPKLEQSSVKPQIVNRQSTSEAQVA
jgi:hypothetical protein